MIYRFDTLDSTNTKAKHLALSGAPDGTVVIAEQQTSGRGRMGRSFDSPAGGGIYLSMILRPDCPPTDLMHLTCAVAVAVCDSIEQALHFRPQIKWINDLVYEGKKLAGILTELSINPQSGLVDFAIIGIGINCNRSITDFPDDLQSIACSASMITGHPVHKELLENAMIAQLRSIDLSQKANILKKYKSNCCTIGQSVTILRGESSLQGVAMDIDDNGALIVRFLDGHTEAVDCGEVSIRRPHCYA